MRPPQRQSPPDRNSTMEITPYLNFDGRCREAFEFYAATFGGTIETMMTHGDSPMKEQTPPEMRDHIMHARLVVDGGAIMGSDAPLQHRAKPQGIWISLNLKDPARAERIFGALSEGGQVAMPFEKTFWGIFGMTTDRFGTPWMINCEPAA